MIVLVVVVFMFSMIYINGNDDVNEPDLVKRWCVTHKKKYNLIIGESWGTMPTDIQQQWIDKVCDQYFCKHNKLFGRGVFKCNHLEEGSQMS